MGKPTAGSKVRGRRKTVKSNQSIISWVRKRKHKTLTQNMFVPQRIPLSCPLVGCNGIGHVNGIDLSHVTLCGCPLYHNVKFEKWAEMRAREEGLVSPVQLFSRTTSPVNSPAKLSKMHPAERAHQFWTSKTEPSLEGLASQIEIYKFRCAQQRLLFDKEKEAAEHLIMCARIASQQLGGANQISGDASHSQADGDQQVGWALEQRIRRVVFGDWEIEPTYPSAYPPDVACLPTIYVCEYCLTPLRHRIAYDRHRQGCTWIAPPGDEIYRKDGLSFFEVDGEKQTDYCRDLCLLTKLFLKHKTVHESDQVPSFLFYVLTEAQRQGHRILGYFSKQKPCDVHETGSTAVMYNNLSCILTLPQYQRSGYGRMLIEMSYILSLLENRIGSPERPLSDRGLILYRKYWKWEILNYLSRYTEKTINIRNMSQDLGIAIPDIVSTLLDMKMLVYFRTQYYILNNKTDVDRLLSAMKPPDAARRIDKSCLHWTPHSIVPMQKSARGHGSSVKVAPVESAVCS
ncbi:Histone acetyltransferase [Fasciolopsis buskii]|uniref:Histone acetyltransferase n=1 Tax=Fasciolopsis buskii TaxID=27845 RepID=A0A8E0RWN3_9TREM|nr:Histone acetyltransferase [Fasciolopsis buski]